MIVNRELQNGIGSVVHWSSTWQLKLVDNKCHHMRVGLISFKPVQYVINNSLLHSVTSSTDLGVKMSSNLSFSEHISSIVIKPSLNITILFDVFIVKIAIYSPRLSLLMCDLCLSTAHLFGHQVM